MASMARLAASGLRGGDHMIHVISPRHLAVTGHARPHPQASRPACPPYASAPLPGIRGRPELGSCEAVTPQRFHAAAHVILLDAQPAG